MKVPGIGPVQAQQLDLLGQQAPQGAAIAHIEELPGHQPDRDPARRQAAQAEQQEVGVQPRQPGQGEPGHLLAQGAQPGLLLRRQVVVPHIGGVADQQGRPLRSRRRPGEVRGVQLQRPAGPEPTGRGVQTGIGLPGHGAVDGPIRPLQQGVVEGAQTKGRVQETQGEGGIQGGEARRHHRLGQGPGGVELPLPVAGGWPLVRVQPGLRGKAKGAALRSVHQGVEEAPGSGALASARALLALVLPWVAPLQVEQSMRTRP